MATKPTMERRTSARLQRKEGAAPYSKSGSSTGLTSYMEKQTLGFDEKDEAEPSRSISIFGRKKAPKEKLPPNWKKAKDKEGKVYYYNTVTQQRSHEVPPKLPPGWREALHKDSGRVYYYHKETRQSTFEFPQAAAGGADDDEDDYSEAEAPDPPEVRTGCPSPALHPRHLRLPARLLLIQCMHIQTNACISRRPDGGHYTGTRKAARTGRSHRIHPVHMASTCR